MTSNETLTPFDEAIKLVCAKNVHQCLWMPATTSHGKLRVSFSTTTNISDGTLPAILFCSPMVGSRYHIVDINHLAVTAGVRVICVDRPGMGGSTPVKLDQRLPYWLEIVPVLLKRLDIEHVSIISHSAGTTYALNTIYHLRHLLDPKAPYVGLVAPWVHNAHSNATLMNMASSLPQSVRDSFAPTVRFVSQRIMPVTSWSGGMFSSVSNVFQKGPKEVDTSSPSSKKHFGVSSDETADQINKLQSKFKFAEDTSAINEDMNLCLKKGGEVYWGICDDYKTYVQELVRKERETVAAGGAKMTIEIFFAESDVMIGKGGQEYLEQCWQQEGVVDTVNFQSEVLPGTDHDSTIADHEKGALRLTFEHVKRKSQGHSGRFDDIQVHYSLPDSHL